MGAGIGQSLYGGALFLFPPRPIPDIWEDPWLNYDQNLEERLIAAGALHSLYPFFTVVAPIPLRLRWKQMAKNLDET